jgi:predicted nucleic acid-binding protein
VIVVDASAMLEVLLNSPAAPAIASRIFAPSEVLHAPHLIDVEVMQVLRRYSMAKSLTSVRVRQAFEDYMNIPLERFPHDVLLPRIWELRRNLTAYDAAYVALAEALDAPLITCDRAIGSAKGHRADVLLF